MPYIYFLAYNSVEPVVVTLESVLNLQESREGHPHKHYMLLPAVPRI